MSQIPTEHKVKWTSRKLWLAVYFEHLFFLAMVKDWMPVNVFESLTWLLLGGYFLGNIASRHIGTKLAGKSSEQ